MMHRIYRAVAPQITPKCRATWISQTTEKLQAMLATEADGDKSTTRKQYRKIARNMLLLVLILHSMLWSYVLAAR